MAPGSALAHRFDERVPVLWSAIEADAGSAMRLAPVAPYKTSRNTAKWARENPRPR